MKKGQPATNRTTHRFQNLRLHLGAFDFTVRILISEDRPRVVRWVRDFFDDPSIPLDRLEECRGVYFGRHGYAPIIWLPRKPQTPREHATLAHEALHVTRIVMGWAGIPMGEDGEEAWAHTLACIVAHVQERARA